MRSKRFVFPSPTDPAASVELAAEPLRRGELRAVVDRVVPFDEIVDACRCVETGRGVGIVVIEQGSGSLPR